MTRVFVISIINEVVTNHNCVDEHIVRAVTNRLLNKIYGLEVSKRDLDNNRKNGFIYVEAITHQLEEYESKRQIYPTFNEFYPKLIDVFKELVQDKK